MNVVDIVFIQRAAAGVGGREGDVLQGAARLVAADDVEVLRLEGHRGGVGGIGHVAGPVPP